MQLRPFPPSARWLRPRLVKHVALGCLLTWVCPAFAAEPTSSKAEPKASAAADPARTESDASVPSTSPARDSATAPGLATASVAANTASVAANTQSAAPSLAGPSDSARVEGSSGSGDAAPGSFRYEPSVPEPEASVARLPPQAYPDTPVRGLVGGSLWLTFHGLPWPYSPFITAAPRTQLGLSGYVWLDSGYRSLSAGAESGVDSKEWYQQGRFVLRATPTYSKGDYFVQGQAELVGAKDPSQNYPNSVGVDDVWLRAGRWNRYDVQVGRFEAWEVYHLGMGLDLHTLERRGAYSENNPRPPEFYGVTYAFYRPSSLGNVAVHLYPTPFLRFEALGQLGNTQPQFGSTPQVGSQFQQNTLAARGAAVLDLGVLKVKAGTEYLKAWPAVTTTLQETTMKGFGGSVQVVLDPHVEFGGNLAYNIVDAVDALGVVDQLGSTDTYSFGGFVNARPLRDLLLGAGTNYTTRQDIKVNVAGAVGEVSHLQSFGAVQYLLLDQLFLKAVVSYAAATHAGDAPEYKDEMLSARLRAMYLF